MTKKQRINICILSLAFSLLSFPTSSQAATASSSQTARQQKDAEANQQDAQRLATEQQKDLDATECQTQYSSQGGGGSGSSAGQFVPVHETGELLTLSGSIDVNTGKSSELLTKLCMYLKAVKRIQTAFETKTFLEDPVARRVGATQAAQYVQNYLKWMQTGARSPQFIANSGGANGSNQGLNDKSMVGDSSFVPGQRDSLRKQASDEAVNNYLDYLSLSGDAYKEETSRAIQYREALPFGQIYKTTVSPQLLDKVVNNDQSITDGSWLDVLVESANPDKPNNPASSKLLAQEELAARKELATNDWNQQMIENGGYLSNKVCVKMSSNGKGCQIWVTLTPGSTIGQGANLALGSKLRQSELMDQAGEIIGGDYPTAQEVAQMSGASNGGGGAGPSWDPLDFLNKIKQFFEQNGGNGGEGGGNGGHEGGDDTTPKITKFVATLSTLAEIASGKANTAKLQWTTSDATSCKAGNDWVSRNTASNGALVLLYAKGASIPINNTITVNLPLSFSTKITKTSGGSTVNLTGDISSSTDVKKITQTTIFQPLTTFSSSDIFTLSFDKDPATPLIKVNGGIVPATATKLITLLKTQIETAKQSATGATLNKYGFTYYNSEGAGTSTNSMSITIKPEYILECSGNNKTVTGNITLSR